MVFNPSWAGAATAFVPDAACGRRQYVVDFRLRALSGVRIHLAAVYDPAGTGRTGETSAVTVTGLR